MVLYGRPLRNAGHRFAMLIAAWTSPGWLTHVTCQMVCHTWSRLSRVAADGITAVKTRSTFRMQCAVSADIEATPDRVWALLTRADDMVRWNSTLTSVEGSVEPRGSVRMQVPE